MVSSREISSRERVLHAVRHEEGDRLPRFVNFSQSVASRLNMELQLNDPAVLKSYFQSDIELYEMQYDCPHFDGKDLFGITYERSPEKKKKVKFHPLESIQGEDDIVYHEWPSPDWADYGMLKRRLNKARADKMYTAVSSGGGVVDQAFNLIGYDNFMSAVNYSPHLINAVIWRLNEFFLEIERRIFTCDLGAIDMCYHINDLSFINRDIFCDFFAGPLAELNRQAKSFGIKTMIYTPGSLPEALIPDLIECGYDVIAPFPSNAGEEDATKDLKDKYGDRITLMGHVNVDSILSLKSPDEVQEHVSMICEDMKPGGGFIIGPDGVIDDSVPSVNILAFYEAIDMYGNYD